MFTGIMYDDYGTLPSPHPGRLAMGSTPSVASARVSHVFGLEGPAMSVNTVCSSSLLALHLAAQAIRAGECEMALASGVTLLATPQTFVLFGGEGTDAGESIYSTASGHGGLAPDGRSKSYSADGDGMSWAEGVGTVLVERLSDARRHGHRVLDCSEVITGVVRDERWAVRSTGKPTDEDVLERLRRWGVQPDGDPDTADIVLDLDFADTPAPVTAVAGLHVRGVPVDWEAFFAGMERKGSTCRPMRSSVGGSGWAGEAYRQTTLDLCRCWSIVDGIRQPIPGKGRPRRRTVPEESNDVVCGVPSGGPLAASPPFEVGRATRAGRIRRTRLFGVRPRTFRELTALPARPERKYMRSARRGVIAVAAVAVLTAGIPVVAEAQPAALAAASVRGSIGYLVDRYGVTESEALRRLDLQRASLQLDKLLKSAFPDSYAGMRLDQDNGGVLRVSFKDLAVAADALAGVADRDHVQTEQVRYSLAELTQARDKIAQEVDAGPVAAFLPAISQADNRVVLWEREWMTEDKTRLDSPARAGESAAAESDAARRVVAADPGMVVSRTLDKPKPKSAQQSDPAYCHPLSCLDKGPIRGGVRLDLKRDNGTWGGCTVGYNVRSSGGGFPNKPWVLTAGHCMATKTNNTPTQHNGTDVVAQHGIEKNSYPYDYAALPYVDDAAAQKWLDGQSEHNLVLKCAGVNGGCDSSTSQQITKVHPLADIMPGWVVCAAGSGSSAVDFPGKVDSGAGAGFQPGTHCGQVLSKDVGINTDVCARAGDSGGPLFTEVDRAALGILEGSQQDRSGPCAAGELNNYSPLETILADLGERVASQGSVFSVITTPQG